MPRRSFRPRTKKPRAKILRRRQQARRSMNASERASLKQTIRVADDPINTVLILDNINLAQFDRAVQVARAYQYYRIKKVEMRFLPLMDTFTDSGLNSVPYFYSLIDKNENLFPVINGFNSLRDAGAKPRRFDDKTIVVSWTPAVPVVTANDSTSVPGISYALPKVAPYLNTNALANLDPSTWSASTVPHKGLVYGVEAVVNTVRGYQVEITAHFDFKKPLSFQENNSEPPAVKKVLTPYE